MKETTYSYTSKKDISYSKFTKYDEKGYITQYRIISGEDTIYKNHIISYDTTNNIITNFLIQKNDTAIVFKAILDSINRVKEIIKYYSFTKGCSQMFSFHTNDGGKDLIYKEKYDYSDTSGKLNKSYVLINKKWEEREVFASRIKKDKIKKNREVVYEYYPGRKDKYVIKYKEFDDCGNWIKYVKYYKRRPISYTERNIEYY